MNDAPKDEAPPPEAAKPEAAPEPEHKWEYRTEFKITGRMREVIELTIKAVEAEKDVLRRKLEKLTYGS